MYCYAPYYFPFGVRMFYSVGSVVSIDRKCTNISVFDFPVCFYYAM